MVDLRAKYPRTLAALRQLQEEAIAPALSYALFEGAATLRQETGNACLTPKRIPLHPGMYYDLASLTKVVATTPTLARLVQAGELAWDDPVAKYLPQLRGGALVRDLLTHSAGIEGYISHRDELNQPELLAALLKEESFGSNLAKNICYTDLGLIFAGLIAEKITGKPIQRLAQEEIIAPLHLEGELTYRPPKGEAVATELTAKRGLVVGEPHDPKAAVLGEHCGSAGLFATLAGLEAYAHALLETNLQGLLTAETMTELFTDQTRLPGQHNRALGWKLFASRGTDRHPVVAHTGFTGTFIVLDRQSDCSLIVLTNRVHPTAKNDAFLDWRDQLFATYLNEKG